MKELICKKCGDTFELDWQDKDNERLYCRLCEEENDADLSTKL
jgi:formylmethanofuran dehydrogenase subunit E